MEFEQEKKLTEKEDVIVRLLSQRVAVLVSAVKRAEKTGGTSKETQAYWQGKAEGYNQAADLIRSTLLSLRIELVGTLKL